MAPLSVINTAIGGGGGGGTTLTDTQIDAIDVFSRDSVTDWGASGIAGWATLGPPDGSPLGRHGADDACVSVSGTDLVIKVCHTRTKSTDDDMRGNGVSKFIDLAEDWTATVKVSSASNGFDGMPTNWGNFRLAVVLGGGDTEGAWFGPVVWFTNNMAGRGWQAIKSHKVPGGTAVVQGANPGEIFQATHATDPPDFWLRLEWSRQGFKSSISTNGSAYTQLAADEYTDPLGSTAALPKPSLLSARLVIMAGLNDTNITDADDAIAFHVEEIVFS